VLRILFLLSSVLAILSRASGVEPGGKAGVCDSLDEAAKASTAYVNAGKYDEAQSTVQAALSCLNAPSLLKVRLLNDLGKVFERQLKFENAERQYRAALEMNRQFPKPSQLDEANILVNLGALAAEQRHFSEGEKLLREARSMLQQMGSVDSALAAAVAGNLGIILLEEGQLTESRRLLTDALRGYRQVSGEQSIDYATALSSAGSLSLQEGKIAESLEETEQALKIQTSLQPKSTYLGAHLLNNLGSALASSGRYAEAYDVLSRCLRMEKELAGRWSFSAIQPLINLASVERARGQISDAAEHAEIAERIANLELKKDDPVLALIWITQGTIEMSRNHAEEAEVLYQRVIAFSPKNSLAYAAALCDVGELATKRHRYKQAQELYERALSADTARYGAQSERVAEDLNNIAAQLFFQRDRTGAIALLEKAESIQVACLGSHNVRTAHTQHNLGVAYTEAKDLQHAEFAYGKAIAALEDAPEPDQLVLEQWLGEYARLLKREHRFAEAEQAQVRSLGMHVRAVIAAEKRAREVPQAGEPVRN
jgi:tetratricopeptide (TPR) repeat protein